MRNSRFRTVVVRVVLALGFLYALTLCVACGRTINPMEVERACLRHMVVVDTIWVEPGHKIGGFVLQSQCK